MPFKPKKSDKPLYQQIRKPMPPPGWAHKSPRDFNKRKDRQELRKEYARQLLVLARSILQE